MKNLNLNMFGIERISRMRTIERGIMNISLKAWGNRHCLVEGSGKKESQYFFLNLYVSS